ncbi:ABC transporter substrate-binding protein [Bacillus sp. OK048]|uniref:ABC transporter substrate-binding protein n=1 Tax=Bacillus sp. OK048 TaxID=1882761 RepID=UPI000886BECA|nr:extracellular solute-binding protein [Bacillus sp. OK048]SDM91865.1 carbohydrate ABC transporter substrate-binding protein, CUT1 family [Bacillus sp. OK048]
MKRNWFILMISVLMVLVLAACGNKEDANSSSKEKKNEDVTLKFYTWINEENGNWKKSVEAFEKEHPGIKVDVNVLVENMNSADYYKKLDLIAASGDTMDVIMLSNSRFLSQRASVGMIEPLNKYMDDEKLKIEEEYDMSASPASAEGEYYGLPSKFNKYLVMLNKDHLDKAGLEVPTDWTWDEYKEYAKKLTTKDHFGSYLHTWPHQHHTMKLLSQTEGTQLLKEDGSSNMDDSMVKASLKLRYELEKEDKTSVPYTDIISQKLDYRQQFFSQQASMVPITSYMVTEWGGFTPEFPITWAPWPKNSESDSLNAFTTADIMSISKKSEHKDAAYEFIRWMTTEGMLVQNKSIPAWKQIDLNDVLKNLAANTTNPDAVDIEALTYVLGNTISSKQFLPASYLTEAYNAFNVEAELYLLGEQDLETTAKKAKQSVQGVIDANKK